MKEQKELLPCPFCGDPPILEEGMVRCGNKTFCPIIPRTSQFNWNEPAIKNWNTRASNQAAEAIIGELVNVMKVVNQTVSIYGQLNKNTGLHQLIVQAIQNATKYLTEK